MVNCSTSVGGILNFSCDMMVVVFISLRIYKVDLHVKVSITSWKKSKLNRVSSLSL